MKDDKELSARVKGTAFRVYDSKRSSTARWTIDEFKHDNYKLDRIPFQEGDCVIDIGANVGVCAMYLAKKYPFLTVYAFEPVPLIYRNLQRGVTRNKLDNVKLFNRALTCDGRDVAMHVYLPNAGGSSAQRVPRSMTDIQTVTVPSLTLDQVFHDYNIQSCRLLKIDCEGSEYEILLHSDFLSRIDYLRAELHINNHLLHQGYTPGRLLRHLEQSIDPSHIFTITEYMAE